MTLIEDLEVASADAEMLGDDMRATRLRAAAERLREEMGHRTLFPGIEVGDVLVRINGGPLGP